MSTAESTTNLNEDVIREWFVRDLVENYPAALTLLTPWGIDTCCGGGRQVGEALSLHGAPVDDVLLQVAALVRAAQPAS